MTGPPLRNFREYLTDGPVVFVPDALAWWLTVHTNLDRVRLAVHGNDARVDHFLHAVAIAARRHVRSGSGDGTNGGTKLASDAESASRLTGGDHVTAQQAADLAGCTDRAVRRAITEHRLPASMVAGRWRIARHDLAVYADRLRRHA